MRQILLWMKSKAGMRRAAGLAVGVAVLLLGGAAAAESKETPHYGKEFHWSGTLAAGKTLEIKGVNGEIRAEAATGKEVVVDAEKHGRRSDPEEVKVEVVERADGVLICVRYPQSGGELSPCEGSINLHDNDVNVDFTVHVPAGVKLVAKTVNGAVEGRGLKSNVVARTVNGSVAVSTSGWVHAGTVNGSIELSMGATDWDGDLEIETVNGAIRLTLPADINARLHARTTNGSIETGFPVTVSGKIGRNHIDGTIGKGGKELRLTTVNGSIALRSSARGI